MLGKTDPHKKIWFILDEKQSFLQTNFVCVCYELYVSAESFLQNEI